MSIWKIARVNEKAHRWVPSYDHPNFDEPLCDKAPPASHAGLLAVATSFDPDICCAECHRLAGDEADP